MDNTINDNTINNNTAERLKHTSESKGSSHSIRRESLKFSNLSEAEFLEGSKIPRPKGDAYPDRKEPRLYHSSDLSKQYMAMKRQESRQNFEKVNTPLQAFFKARSK